MSGDSGAAAAGRSPDNRVEVSSVGTLSSAARLCSGLSAPPPIQTTVSVKLLETQYLLSELRNALIYTCDNFCIKSILYNKGSILRNTPCLCQVKER